MATFSCLEDALEFGDFSPSFEVWNCLAVPSQESQLWQLSNGMIQMCHRDVLPLNTLLADRVMIWSPVGGAVEVQTDNLVRKAYKVVIRNHHDDLIPTSNHCYLPYTPGTWVRPFELHEGTWGPLACFGDLESAKKFMEEVSYKGAPRLETWECLMIGSLGESLYSPYGETPLALLPRNTLLASQVLLYRRVC